MSQQEKTSEITANEYDADQTTLANLNASIHNLQSKEVSKRAAIAVTHKKMVTAIVRAYVYGAADAQILALFNQDVTNSRRAKGLRG